MGREKFLFSTSFLYKVKIMTKDIILAGCFSVGFLIISILLIDISELNETGETTFTFISFLVSIGMYVGSLRVFKFITIFNEITLDEMEDNKGD